MLRRYLMMGATGVLLMLLAVTRLATGMVFSQGSSTPERLFTVYQELGDPYPQGLRYNQVLDQYAMIDVSGQLVLVDAPTFAVQHVLYPAGTTLNAYEFSHNGLYLAIAIDRRIEVWDTQTGEKLAEFEPDGSLASQRPLYWSDADDLLGFETVVRAPQAIRRSENDTSILPWIWDVAAAKRERGSRLPGKVEALPFFENRGGVVFGANDTVIAAVAERLQIYQFDDKSINLVSEVVNGRAELDPLAIWRSLGGTPDEQQLYIRNDLDKTLVQINTKTKLPVALPVGRTLTPELLDTVKGTVFGSQTLMIGEPSTQQSNSLLEFLLGKDYLAQSYDYGPITVILLDILQPVTVPPNQYGVLLYIRNEATGTSQIKFLPSAAQNIVISRDEQQIMVRRVYSDQRIEVYDLHSGAFLRSYLPSVRDLTPNHVLAYNTTGDQIISDWQRIDAATGKTLIETPYLNSFDSFYFSDDSTKMLTTRGSEWMLWEIATRQLLRRATMEIHGSVISISENGERYLSILDGASGIEIYNVATGERRQLIFEPIDGRNIQDIVASPDWQHYLVIYSDNPNSAYSPGQAAAMYAMDAGKLWVMSDDDLPQFSQYGWLDDESVYFYSDYNYDSAPERIFGIDYDASGLPECLVQQFPERYTQWLNIWEYLTLNLRVDTLNRTAQEVCALVAEGEDAVNGYFYPTPYPTFEYNTPTPVLVAGIPSCLTQQFPDEALDYATDWRRITEGLTAEQVAELETLLCRNLTGEGNYDYGYYVSTADVLTVDLNGKRASGNYIPFQEQTTRSGQPIFDAFVRVERRDLNSPKLSPDGQMVAEFNYNGGVTIYQINEPYDAFIDDVTATVQAQITAQNLIGVRPTETAAFTPAGTAQPSLTPTMTVTSPPRPEESVEQPKRDTVNTVNTDDTLYTLANLPQGWNPPGRLILPPIKEYSFGEYLPTPTPGKRRSVPLAATPLPTIEGATPQPTREPRRPTATPTFSIKNMDTIRQQYSNSMWLMSPVDGSVTRDETIPQCDVQYDCQFSFNRRWIWYNVDGTVVLSRPDGSQTRILSDASVHPVYPPDSYHWTGEDTLEFNVYRIERDPEYPVTYIQRIDPDTGADSGLVGFPYIVVNNLPTDVISYQPAGGNLALVDTTYPTGRGTTGYKFYLYDISTGESTFFARASDPLNVFWSPAGDRLFYRYPSGKADEPWYVYDVATQTHLLFGTMPSGDWSPDGRYIVDWYHPDNDEIRRLKDAGEPLPKITIYDMQTGLTRQYFIPQTGYTTFTGSLLWSPDIRYLTFRATLAEEADREGAEPHLLILDTQTGNVVDLGFDVNSPVAWVDSTSTGGGE